MGMSEHHVHNEWVGYMGRRDGYKPVSLFVDCLGCVYTILHVGVAALASIVLCVEGGGVSVSLYSAVYSCICELRVTLMLYPITRASG